MRIALVPVGSEGDVRPTIALARRLMDHGHEVVVGAAPDFEPLADLHGVPYRAIGASFRPIVESFASQVNGRAISGLRVMLKWCAAAIREQFEELGPVLRGADVVVGSGLQFGAASFAERGNIPYHHVGHMPILLPSRHYPPVVVPWRQLPRWLNRFMWFLTDHGMDLALKPSIDRHRAMIGLKSIGNFTEFFSRHFLVAIDPELAPLPPDVRPGAIQTGYWRIEDESELPENVERFLACGEPPVYFGFGSMGDENPHETSRIIAEAIRRLGCRGIVAKGWATLGLDELSDRVLVVGHVPHAKLFPRVSAVVHHGGAGTTWITARSGAPHVVVPHVLDQYYWAQRLQELGISGTALDRRKWTGVRLEKSIRQAMDPSRRPSLQKLASALAARDGIEEAVTYICHGLATKQQMA